MLICVARNKTLKNIIVFHLEQFNFYNMLSIFVFFYTISGTHMESKDKHYIKNGIVTYRYHPQLGSSHR